MNPDFQQMVKSGAFRNRSVAINPDMTLRHVGFLGAVPPAVKGLKPVQFRDQGAAVEFEFAIAEPDQKPERDQNKQPGTQQFSARDEIAEITELRQQVEALRRDNRKNDFTAFCDKLGTIGKLTPAQKSLVAEFMEIMHGAGTYMFSDTGERPAIEVFKEFIEALPTQVHMKEIATKEFAAGKNVNPDIALGQQIADSLKHSGSMRP